MKPSIAFAVAALLQATPAFAAEPADAPTEKQVIVLSDDAMDEVSASSKTVGFRAAKTVEIEAGIRGHDTGYWQDDIQQISGPTVR
jgi:hypothetical protein